MSFVSEIFLGFLLLLWGVYFLTPHKYRWMVLLLASYAFYAYADLRAIGYMLCTTLTTFLLARHIQRLVDVENQQLSAAPQRAKDLRRSFGRRRRRWLLLGLLINFGLLCFVKYANFLLSIASLFKPGEPFPTLSLLVPLGISFYTFQSTGYLIDVYRKRFRADTNLAKYALFVSFFPQLLQGPISRHEELAHQLYQPPRVTAEDFRAGLLLMLYGYFKKMVIADRIAVIVNPIFADSPLYTGPFYIFAILCYSFQIYADFSGGIDIIAGLSQTLGIRLPKNFERPYFSRSISEFWQRWHITLGRWMREYIFYPLTLSKPFLRMGKRLRTSLGVFWAKTIPSCLGSILVFLLVGIWHGASWAFVCYGLYQGLLVTLGTVTEPLSRKMIGWLHIDTQRFSWRLFQILRTFALVCFGRFFARASSAMAALRMMKSSLGALRNPLYSFYTVAGNLQSLGLDTPNLVVLALALGVLLLLSVLSERGVSIRSSLAAQNLWFRWTVYLGAIFALLVFGVYGMGYESGAFLYQGL